MSGRLAEGEAEAEAEAALFFCFFVFFGLESFCFRSIINVSCALADMISAFLLAVAVVFVDTFANDDDDSSGGGGGRGNGGACC